MADKILNNLPTYNNTEKIVFGLENGNPKFFDFKAIGASVYQPYFLLEDYGATTKETIEQSMASGTDSAAALQAALNDIKAQNGGTLVFPKGVTKLKSDSSINFNTKRGKLTLKGQGTESIVHIERGATTTLSIANTNQVIIEDLLFLGSPVQPSGDPASKFLDVVRNVLRFEAVYQPIVRNCQFIGIAIDAPYTEYLNNKFEANAQYGIIHADTSDLLVEDVLCGGNATNQCATINVNNYQGLTVRNFQTLDYGYHRNLEVSKTSLTSRWWIRALNQLPALDATARGKVSISNAKFDEATLHSIGVYDADSVEIDNASVNIGIDVNMLFNNVKTIRARDVHIGWHNNAIGMLFENCSRAYLDYVRFTAGDYVYPGSQPGTVKYVYSYSGPEAKFEFKNCKFPGGDLAANGFVNPYGSEYTFID